LDKELLGQSLEDLKENLYELARLCIELVKEKEAIKRILTDITFNNINEETIKAIEKLGYTSIPEEKAQRLAEEIKQINTKILFRPEHRTFKVPDIPEQTNRKFFIESEDITTFGQTPLNENEDDEDDDIFGLPN
jgi:predicted enzyme involved in methoxymalonyl-ACP biosynthesis